MKNCERCGDKPPIETKGEFAGSRSMHDYCNYCSEDLCEECMLGTVCDSAVDGSHEPWTGDDDE